MKFEISTPLFREAIDVIKTIVSFKDDEYNHLLLEAENDTLFITAADASVGLTLKLPTNIFENLKLHQQGSVVVEASTLIKIISAIKPFTEKDGKGCKSILFDEVDGKAMILYDVAYGGKKSTNQVRALPMFESSSVFRTWLEEPGSSFLSLPSSTLNKAISKVAYASGIDELDMRLGNISFDTVEEGDTEFVRLMATNGVKLAKFHIPVGPDSGKNFENFLLPTKLAKRLLKIIPASLDSSDIVFSFLNNRLLLKSIDSFTTVSCPMFVGGFPNCERLFLDPVDNTVVDKELLFDAVFGLNQISDEDDNRVTVSFSNDKCKVSVQGNTLGESSDISIAAVESDRLYDFNARLLLDTLKNMNSDLVCIKFYTGTPSRVMFEEITEDGSKGLNSILVPLRRY